MGFLAKKPAGAGPSALTTRHRGQQAEDAALAHLQAAGLRLVERNYRTPGRGGGEIDLIVQARDGTVVFVEVRSRGTRAFGGEMCIRDSLKAHVRAEGRSGVRRLRIREHQVISDSPPDFAGYNLGPSSPELQLGVLGTCVTHIFLIQAAERQVPVESLEVEVTGIIDPRGGRPGHEATPIWPHEIGYTVHIDSPASRAEIDALFEAVERTCPILNLLRNPQNIRAEVRHTDSSAAARLAA